MPELDHSMLIKVRDYELDAQGIVNNANYLHYLELTRHDFCERFGIPFGEMHRRGLDPVVRKVEIEYLSSLRSGDTMDSRLRMDREGARFVFTQQIFNAATGEAVVKARVTVVCLENGRMSRGDLLAEAFADYLKK